MKFLLFNLVVAASLYYLFHAGELTPTMLEGRTQALVTRFDQSATASPRNVDKEKTEAAVAPKAPPAPNIDQPKKKPAAIVQKAVAIAPIVDIPAAKSEVSPSPPLPPKVAQRRAEVLGEVPVTSIPTTPAPVLIPRSIRRQELHALAEEMEFRSLSWRSD